jgi:hypothetical protein
MTELARQFICNGRKHMVRRPDARATQRIVSYRTLVCLGYNEAYAAGADLEVLDYLRAEHEWAMERMIEAGITPPGHARVEPKGQMELGL